MLRGLLTVTCEVGPLAVKALVRGRDTVLGTHTRARRCGTAISVPANRAARFVAVAAPIGTDAASSSGQLRVATATAAVRAPAAAVRYPASKAGPRPARAAIRAVDTAARAAPMAVHVNASPPTTSEPDNRAADNAATATPVPTPAPPKIWARTSTARVRRCTCSACRVDSSPAPTPGSATTVAARSVAS